MTTCAHHLGALPCDRTSPHPGHGDGCTHTAAWAPDAHHADTATQEDR